MKSGVQNRPSMVLEVYVQTNTRKRGAHLLESKAGLGFLERSHGAHSSVFVMIPEVRTWARYEVCTCDVVKVMGGSSIL